MSQLEYYANDYRHEEAFYAGASGKRDLGAQLERLDLILTQLGGNVIQPQQGFLNAVM